MAPMLPLPGSALAPKYWMSEVSGILRPVVRAYLNNPESLNDHDVIVLAAYLDQWVASPVWDMNPSHDEISLQALAFLRESVKRIRTPRDVSNWLRAALVHGIDPL